LDRSPTVDSKSPVSCDGGLDCAAIFSIRRYLNESKTRDPDYLEYGYFIPRESRGRVTVVHMCRLSDYGGNEMPNMLQRPRASPILRIIASHLIPVITGLSINFLIHVSGIPL
jgi:hypothetical protein